MKAVRPVIVSNGIPYLQMTSEDSNSTLERDMEEEREMIDVHAIWKSKESILTFGPIEGLFHGQ